MAGKKSHLKKSLRGKTIIFHFSSTQYLLRTYSVADNVLSARGTKMKKTHLCSLHLGVTNTEIELLLCVVSINEKNVSRPMSGY